MTDPTRPDVARTVITQCSAFADVSDEAVDELAAKLRSRSWQQGETILRQGDPADRLMFLAAGAARVDVLGAHGAAETVARVGPTDVVGEMALVTRQARMAEVVAECDVSGYELSSEDFDSVAARHPELGAVLTHLVASRLGGGEVDGLVGKTVDRYRIIRCAGRGGMAVVYEAVDVASGDRVALKMMSHRLLYERGGVARFRREADLLLTVEHPHIARVHSRFSAYRTHFIAMEFCNGPTLAERITARGPLAPADVRRIVGQVASALTALHARGIVHRDVKPSNVILTTVLTAGDSAKLTDFGLAKRLVGEEGVAVTEGRTILGTPPYMSPEALLGDESGPATDVYALGCLALEALTGRCPFSETTYSDLARAKRGFASRQAAASAGAIDDELRAFLGAALAPTPDRRALDLARVAAWAG